MKWTWSNVYLKSKMTFNYVHKRASERTKPCHISESTHKGNLDLDAMWHPHAHFSIDKKYGSRRNTRSQKIQRHIIWQAHAHKRWIAFVIGQKSKRTRKQSCIEKMSETGKWRLPSIERQRWYFSLTMKWLGRFFWLNKEITEKTTCFMNMLNWKLSDL